MRLDKVCLVITGTVFPTEGVFQLKVKNPQERRKQYIDTINFFLLKSNIKNIVFCENSGAKIEAEISELAIKKGKNFEWLSFLSDSEKILNQGKGYGEGEIMEYVLKNSKIMMNCDYIIKITGRLKLKNINSVLKFCNEKMNYFDNRKEGHVDTRFYMIQKNEFKKYLERAYFSVDDRRGYYLEHAYFDAMNKDNITFMDFPIAIAIEGIGGSDGVIYHKSWFRVIGKTIINWGKNIIK